jgi:tRNA (cmo5U34)-methyltransferase
MELNGFDRISPAYDFLARLIFGESIVKAQIYFLRKIRARSKVLILGGGTGWIIAELFKIQSDCEVWYIDASIKMIVAAKKKTGKEHRVHLIHGTAEDIPPIVKFNVVVTNFYLDMFGEDSLQHVVEKIQYSLASNSIWIATDFVKGQEFWKRMILKMMYTFFRLTCKIESSQLPDWTTAIEKSRGPKMEIHSFYRGFIESRVYC